MPLSVLSPLVFANEAKAGQILINKHVLMTVEHAMSVKAVGEFALKGIRRHFAPYNTRRTIGRYVRRA
jgi:class 3 adenylate cyclase